MPDMNYTNSPEGYNLQTSAGPSFSAPGGGGLDINALFAKMAAKKAEEQRMAQEAARRERESQLNLMNSQMNQPGPIRDVETGAPSSQMMMDNQGNWKDWIDPNAASMFNTGKVLPGSTARKMGQSDSSVMFTK